MRVARFNREPIRETDPRHPDLHRRHGQSRLRRQVLTDRVRQGQERHVQLHQDGRTEDPHLRVVAKIEDRLQPVDRTDDQVLQAARTDDQVPQVDRTDDQLRLEARIDDRLTRKDRGPDRQVVAQPDHRRDALKREPRRPGKSRLRTREDRGRRGHKVEGLLTVPANQVSPVRLKLAKKRLPKNSNR